MKTHLSSTPATKPPTVTCEPSRWGTIPASGTPVAVVGPAAAPVIKPCPGGGDIGLDTDDMDVETALVSIPEGVCASD